MPRDDQKSKLDRIRSSDCTPRNNTVEQEMPCVDHCLNKQCGENKAPLQIAVVQRPSRRGRRMVLFETVPRGSVCSRLGFDNKNMRKRIIESLNIEQKYLSVHREINNNDRRRRVGLVLFLAFAFGSLSFFGRIFSADVMLRQMALRFLLFDRLNGVFLQLAHVFLHVALLLRMLLFTFDDGLYM